MSAGAGEGTPIRAELAYRLPCGVGGLNRRCGGGDRGCGRANAQRGRGEGGGRPRRAHHMGGAGVPQPVAAPTVSAVTTAAQRLWPCWCRRTISRIVAAVRAPRCTGARAATGPCRGGCRRCVWGKRELQAQLCNDITAGHTHDGLSSDLVVAARYNSCAPSTCP